ncbi:AMP-binding protein [uncultured Parasphingorhabdus sp.]|uniref:AMP-binding protein n=1 Tax=uncultured Parasphingorhabdus sp. TaxID=2709694 RepID=UPI002AA8ED54|nr:AMP-binding protein [uncultured Parasphingorhabdus sp.]
MKDFEYFTNMASEDPEGFWATRAEALDWFRKWDRILDETSTPIPTWFEGGRINATWNCVDRHVASGHGEQTAIRFESPFTNCSRTLTYAELLDRVSKLAGALSKRGITVGDRVLIYMPNSPEAIIAMLACARIGAIHSVVFGGFAAAELAVRIDDCEPNAILTASCGIEGKKILPYQPIIEDALNLARYTPNFVVFWQREEQPANLSGQPKHNAAVIDWNAAIEDADPVDCVPVDSTHPLYILYTSGTTGQPKGVVRDTGGYLTALAWTMNAVYDCPSEATFWAASDVGWVVGHSYMGYGPLLARCTTIIFEGKPVGTPDAGIFWRTIAQHKVRTFFTAPTAIRAIRQADPEASFLKDVDLSHLKIIFLAGERTDPDTLEWLAEKVGVPVIDHWWQTETGWPICANPSGIELLPVKAGSTGPALPGWHVCCLDDRGEEVAREDTGALAIRLPLPPGAAPTLWNAADRYHQAYLSRFEGYYQSGDAGFIDEGGYVHVMGRTDDVINVAGHRLSSSAIEEILAKHDAVADCAVIGVADQLKGELPHGFVVLKAGEPREAAVLKSELVAAVRKQIGPVASFKTVHIVQRLPKTRSGKILRRTMRQIADGQPVSIPATIEDPRVLDDYYQLYAAVC